MTQKQSNLASVGIKTKSTFSIIKGLSEQKTEQDKLIIVEHPTKKNNGSI